MADAPSLDRPRPMIPTEAELLKDHYCFFTPTTVRAGAAFLSVVAKGTRIIAQYLARMPSLNEEGSHYSLPHYYCLYLLACLFDSGGQEKGRNCFLVLASVSFETSVICFSVLSPTMKTVNTWSLW